MKRLIKKTAVLLIVVCILAIIIRLVVGEPCYVPSDSMEPTILSGDWLWINKLSYGGKLPERLADIPLLNIFTNIEVLRNVDEKNEWSYHRLPGFKNPQIGDVVVFANPENEMTLLVKRVVEVRHKGDTIFVGNNSFFTDHIHKEVLRYGVVETKGKKSVATYYVLSQDHYYALGDNSGNSRDSRFFGYVPEQLVAGRVTFGILSFEKDDIGKNRLRKGRIFFNVQ